MNKKENLYACGICPVAITLEGLLNKKENLYACGICPVAITDPAVKDLSRVSHTPAAYARLL